MQAKICLKLYFCKQQAVLLCILILSLVEVAGNFWVIKCCGRCPTIWIWHFGSDYFDARGTIKSRCDRRKVGVSRFETSGPDVRLARGCSHASVERFEIGDLLHRWIWELEQESKIWGGWRLLSETCIRFRAGWQRFGHQGGIKVIWAYKKLDILKISAGDSCSRSGTARSQIINQNIFQNTDRDFRKSYHHTT